MFIKLQLYLMVKLIYRWDQLFTLVDDVQLRIWHKVMNRIAELRFTQLVESRQKGSEDYSEWEEVK